MAFRVKNFSWNVQLAKAAIDSGASRGLSNAAEHVLEAANRTVPLDEGTLMRSGTTSVEGTRAVVSYNTPYAVRVHEHPEYNFQRGRRGKWLELTLNEEGKAIERILSGGFRGLL